ncbi:MAG: molybdopterin molybdotransferase MoeA [Marmoricola sp.]
MSSSVSVDECLADILDRVQPSAAYPHLLLESLGLTADREVLSTGAIPSVDCAAFDGYAVRAIDTQGASATTPVTLGLVGAGAVGSGTCVPVAAGAAMPAGTDAVIAYADSDRGDAQVRISAAAYSGLHVRRAGDDIAKGDVLLEHGNVVGPRDIGLLAGLGIEQVSVAPRPRVVVISTGAELVEPGRNAGAGEIHDANSYLLAATVRAAGAIAYRVQVPSNDPAVFAEVLDDQLVRADLVVTTSGKVDVVRAVLAREPGVRFADLAMHPGPSLGWGFMGPERTPIFALPSDPVAAYISFTVFVAPALRRLSGRTPETRPMFRAQLTEDVRSRAGKKHYVCAEFVSDGQGARVSPIDGSGDQMLGGLSGANALIVLREDVASAKAGDPVPIILIDRDY